MWVAGICLVILIGVALTLAADRRPRPMPALPLWDIPRVAGSYTTIVGALSGFTVASSVFIANISGGSREYEDTMGMFILAFLILIGATMEFATTPNLSSDVRPSYLGDQQLSYTMANASFYLGIAISWLGLRRLVLAIGFEEIAMILTWVLLFSIIAGAVRLSMHAYRHTLANPIACFAVPPVALGLVLIYRYALVESWGGLWPAENESLSLAAAAFCVGGLAYGAQTLLLTLHGNQRWGRIVAAFGSKWLLVYNQAVVTMIFLVWTAVSAD
jgi:hypothetical protein